MNAKTWFEKTLDKMRDDPEYKVEYCLMQLTESICAIHRKQGLRIRFILWLIERLTYISVYKINSQKGGSCGEV